MANIDFYPRMTIAPPPRRRPRFMPGSISEIAIDEEIEMMPVSANFPAVARPSARPAQTMPAIQAATVSNRHQQQIRPNSPNSLNSISTLDSNLQDASDRIATLAGDGVEMVK